MEIRPTTVDLAQFTKGRDGRLVPVENDVQNVANSLNQINSRFRLRYSEAGEYFVVYFLPEGAEEGDGYLVTTAQELDQRLVKRVEEIYWRTLNDPSYSLNDELEKLEAKKKKERDHEWLESHGDMYERLAHAMRKDLGYDQDRIVVSRDV